MSRIDINKEITGEIKRSLEEKIIDYIKDVVVFTNIDEMINNVNVWYDSCNSMLKYTKSDGSCSYINTSCIYSNYSRKFVYETLINYLEKTRKLTKYFVVIPAGNGEYVTLCRLSSGSLVLGDKRYRNIETIKRHNSYVPGGITIEEVKSSCLDWCLPFMEEIDE